MNYFDELPRLLGAYVNIQLKKLLRNVVKIYGHVELQEII